MEEYNFLEYLLDNHLLEPEYTWENVNDVPPQIILLYKDIYYDKYKKYCKKNDYYIEKIY